MLHLNLILPSHRLKISLSPPSLKFRRAGKRRSLRGKEGIFENLKNVRQGSRVSRLFRNLFEHRKTKRILGISLVFLVILASFFSRPASASEAKFEPELTTLSAGALQLTTKVGVHLPLENFTLSQKYSRAHPGIDLAAPSGEPVFPIIEGRVESTVSERYGYGNYLVVNHGSGLKSLYAHFSKIKVKAGEEVGKDKIIGLVGRTGSASGNHLHLEIFENDHYLNPATVLQLK